MKSWVLKFLSLDSWPLKSQFRTQNLPIHIHFQIPRVYDMNKEEDCLFSSLFPLLGSFYECMERRGLQHNTHTARATYAHAAPFISVIYTRTQYPRGHAVWWSNGEKLKIDYCIIYIYICTYVQTRSIVSNVGRYVHGSVNYRKVNSLYHYIYISNKQIIFLYT